MRMVWEVCVKSCREVQEDQNTDVARIHSDEEIVGDLDESSFCAMACPETRLKRFIELVVGLVLLELGCNCPFQDFAQGRLEIGWYLCKSSGSRPGFLKMGVTEAVLKMDITMPDSRDELIMSRVAHRAGREDFTSVVGMGSRKQVEALAWETNLTTEIESTGEKEEREHWGRQTVGGSVVCVSGACGRVVGDARSCWGMVATFPGTSPGT